MKHIILVLIMMVLSGCANVLANDDSLDDAGYTTYSGLSQDQNPGMETSTKMVNAALRK